jgi:hypothetical protein
VGKQRGSGNWENPKIARRLSGWPAIHETGSWLAHRRVEVSDWSKDAALRFAAQQTLKQGQDAKAIREQNDLAANIAKVWVDLCDLFKARCAEFNAEPGVTGILSCDTKRAQELKITRSDNAAMLRGAFDVKRHTIHFIGPNIGKEKSEIKIEVIEGSSKMRFVDILHRTLEPQDIVDISLTDLLQLN